MTPRAYVDHSLESYVKQDFESLFLIYDVRNVMELRHVVESKHAIKRNLYHIII